MLMFGKIALPTRRAEPQIGVRRLTQFVTGRDLILFPRRINGQHEHTAYIALPGISAEGIGE